LVGSIPATLSRPVFGEGARARFPNTGLGGGVGERHFTPFSNTHFFQSQATTVARAQILKQIKELYDLKECGALSANEYEDAKAVVLRDFK